LFTYYSHALLPSLTYSKNIKVSKIWKTIITFSGHLSSVPKIFKDVEQKLYQNYVNFGGTFWCSWGNSICKMLSTNAEMCSHIMSDVHLNMGVWKLYKPIMLFISQIVLAIKSISYHLVKNSQMQHPCPKPRKICNDAPLCQQWHGQWHYSDTQSTETWKERSW